MSVAKLLDGLSNTEVREALRQCCGATRWVERMADARPFVDDERLFALAERIWWRLDQVDWVEAFSQHPRIGARSGTSWSMAEQRGMQAASAETRAALLQGNRDYEKRFGHVFLICATGRSADDMRHELERRLGNAPDVERRIAAHEQAKITRLRLEKLGIS